MHIAITVDPYIPVPPHLYGGIERVVDFLVRGLMDRGHRVTLFAHPDSRVDGTLVPYGVPPHQGRWPRLVELVQVSAGLWRRRAAFNLIHSFGRLAALVPVLPLRRLPKVQSYQRGRVPWKSVRRAVFLGGDSIRFTGCSASVFQERPLHGKYGGRWQAIYNGADLVRYAFVASLPAEAPLAFLGRLEPCKGPHHAIAIARAAGRRLLIAGNQVRSGPAADYFDRQIAPHIDGDRVRYLGPVHDGEKNSLLGASAALLMPIEWEEPFGIVMAEAMACGTPVIGFPRGSVPEVVRDGVNGYLCRNVSEAVHAVRRLDRIDRAVVRADCAARFSAPAVVDSYERLYQAMCG